MQTLQTVSSELRWNVKFESRGSVLVASQRGLFEVDEAALEREIADAAESAVAAAGQGRLAWQRGVDRLGAALLGGGVAVAQRPARSRQSEAVCILRDPNAWWRRRGPEPGRVPRVPPRAAGLSAHTLASRVPCAI